ncbi:MAG: CoB--CoM heterodisulfide reductase iron-sulfur subunit B family protein [Deltaproteobacteria bacterium]|nr:CoB--CoM heterodisulfide reductase iron-sulfur subunit B family protein [Deltaproteobacteria bacterium]
MKINYYPGCTLKTKAKNLENAAISSMQILGIEMEEIERWNCCGAVYSLTDDDLIHQVAPVRNLIRVKEQGGDKLITICSMCYNTLARANLLMQQDKEKRDTINRFMDEEIDYFGEVQVIHLLNFLRDAIGWKKIRKKVKVPLADLKIAVYYGCTLQRPPEVGIEPIGSYELMTELLESLGATVVDFPAAAYCCGSYQVVGNEDAAQNAASIILDTARVAGVDALATSCPLCEFNLGKNQDALIQQQKIFKKIPTFYFTQLMAIAFGLDSKTCLFELNDPAGVDLLTTKECIGLT